MPSFVSQPTLDPMALESVASTILGLQNATTQATANATGETISAQGAQGEAAAYTNAEQIAKQNAALEAVSGQIAQFQETYQLNKAVGEQKAGIGAAGIMDSGSALDLLQSSYQQGYLAQQLLQTQTAIQQGGFLEQGAAAEAERAAAQTSADAELALAASDTQNAQTATANQTAATKSLFDMLNSLGPSQTNQQLIAAINSGNLAQVQEILNGLSPTAKTATNFLLSTRAQGLDTINPVMSAQYGLPSAQSGPHINLAFATSGVGDPGFSSILLSNK